MTALDERTPEDDARARRLFPRLDWHALWADDETEEWILHPLIPARRLVSIFSAPKVGKSLLMLEVAAALAARRQALGTTPTRHYRVLYVDFENDPQGDVKTRLQDMGYGPEDLDLLDYLSFPTMAALDSERGGLELLEAALAYRSEVVVIDTVSRAVAGEENSNDTWLGFYRHTGLKLKQAGVSLVRLDHSGKDETKGQRGGSAKEGDVDAVWKLTTVARDDQYRLDCTVNRFQLDIKTLNLTRRSAPTLHHAVDGASLVNSREARIQYLVGLADELRLPRDASRAMLKQAFKDRGEAARNDVLSAVGQARKAVPAARGQVPSRGQRTGEISVGDGPGQPPYPCTSDALLPVPGTPGQAGTGGGVHLSPSPPPHRGGQGGTGTGDAPRCGCGNVLHNGECVRCKVAGAA